MIETLCKHCDHFVEENYTSTDKVLATTATTVTLEGYDKPMARFIHLEDDDHDYNHDAEPGVEHDSTEWASHRPDLFVEHSDGRIGPNSEFHVHPNTYVYLTNGCCEDTGKSKSRLTKVESQYIGDGLTGKDGTLILDGYSVLMDGKKYFAPTIEHAFRSDDNGDKELPDHSEAIVRAMETFDAAMKAIEPLGGKVRLDAFDGPGEDRHTVIAMIPVDVVMKQFPQPNAYRKWLVSFFG